MYGSVRKSVVTYSAPFLLLNAAANYFRLGIVIRDSHHSRVDVRIDHLDAGIFCTLLQFRWISCNCPYPLKFVCYFGAGRGMKRSRQRYSDQHIIKRFEGI